MNFTDYSYDAATGVLKIDGAKVTDASYTIRAAGEKFTATVTPEVGRLRFTGDKTVQIGTDYTAKLSDSKGGTSTLPEYIAVLIDGYMLDEEFFSYDKNTDIAPLYARKIRKTIGNTTATAIRLTMKNADIAGKNDESVIFCDGDLDIVLVGENKITPVSAMPTPSLAPTSMRANENTAADGDGLSTYGMPICVQGSLTISGTLMLSACSGGRGCTLIAAGYSGGRLDGVKSLPLGAQSPNISAAVSELCPELAGSEKLKAMLWNGFMPIAPNAEN